MQPEYRISEVKVVKKIIRRFRVRNAGKALDGRTCWR